jgi:hypothetical protein
MRIVASVAIITLDTFPSRQLSITTEAAFCIETLEDALARQGKPEIFNTDLPLPRLDQLDPRAATCPE